MDFIYAKELKTKFNVFGKFYDLRLPSLILPCRNTLDIFSKKISASSNSAPDAVVIMMNPGSSHPMDSSYRPETFKMNEIGKLLEGKFVPTRPDNAQYQIMRVMLHKKWKHVRVINLSDLRNGNSKSFSKKFIQAALLEKSNPHCVTHPNRRDELSKSLNTKDGGPIIAAWGKEEVLRESASSIIEIVPDLIGISFSEPPWYHYASPTIKKYKLRWLENIIKKIEQI